MRDSFGNALSVTIFGESHGTAIGGVVQGIAPGAKIDEEFIRQQMEKRRAVGKISTARKEADKVNFLSGVKDGLATGTAIAFYIENTNTKSADYTKTENLLRPGHADFTAYAKYNGFQDIRGGGHFSGRLTAPLVAAGSMFLHILKEKNVIIETHIKKCAKIEDASFSNDITELKKQLQYLQNSDFGTLSDVAKDEMIKAITKAANEGDSVGGILQTAVIGLPSGFGEPFFSSVESVLAQMLFSIPAVKGLSFGAGFKFADMQGSQANDAFYMNNGEILTKTNNNGGVNGGITNGMPIVFETVIKPTPSIYKQQDTVDFNSKTDAKLQINGRHDPCIVHRARIVQTCATAIAIADVCNMAQGTKWQEGMKWNMA